MFEPFKFLNWNYLIGHQKAPVDTYPSSGSASGVCCRLYSFSGLFCEIEHRGARARRMGVVRCGGEDQNVGWGKKKGVG